MSFDAKCYVYIEVKIRPEALRFLDGRDDAPITTECVSDTRVKLSAGILQPHTFWKLKPQSHN